MGLSLHTVGKWDECSQLESVAGVVSVSSAVSFESIVGVVRVVCAESVVSVGRVASVVGAVCNERSECKICRM